MEIADLAERIIHDIHVVYSREPYIDEFDIIPIFESQNKSPVVNVGPKMALEAWCVKFLYLHVYARLMEWREKKLRSDDCKIIQWLEVLLLLNPDVATAWNIRKELFVLGKISPSAELRLCRLILTRKPKSPEVFIHRRWSINKRLEEGHLSECEARERMIADELELCTVASSRYPNNYCAWSHRQWVHGTLAVISQNTKILLDELAWSETYNRQHVSDHSGFQFRQYLLKTMMDHHINAHDSCSWGEPLLKNIKEVLSQEADDGNSPLQDSFISKLLWQELSLTRNLVHDYPGHETLWYHIRFIIHSLHALQIINSNFPTSSGPICKRTRTDCLGKIECNITTLENELCFTNQILVKDPLHCFANRHKQWLTHEFKLEL